MHNIVTFNNHVQNAIVANNIKAREIAREIEAQSDASALVLLDSLASLYSARFMRRVYAALESLT